MKLEGTRFVMSPGGSALGLPAGEYWAVPAAELERAQERIAELEAQHERQTPFALDWRDALAGIAEDLSVPVGHSLAADVRPALKNRLEQLEASWVKATAEADAWRFWAAQKHGASLASDAAARENVDGAARFINDARVRLQKELHTATERLSVISRIVRRSLECGQLEKLEDARRYLDDADQPATTEVAQCPTQLSAGQCCLAAGHLGDCRWRIDAKPATDPRLAHALANPPGPRGAVTAPDCTCGAQYSARAHEKHCAFQVWSFGRALELSTEALAVPVYECGDRTCGLCWACSKQGNAPQGTPLNAAALDMADTAAVVGTDAPPWAPVAKGSPQKPEGG